MGAARPWQVVEAVRNSCRERPRPCIYPASPTRKPARKLPQSTARKVLRPFFFIDPRPETATGAKDCQPCDCRQEYATRNRGSYRQGAGKAPQRRHDTKPMKPLLKAAPRTIAWVCACSAGLATAAWAPHEAVCYRPPTRVSARAAANPPSAWHQERQSVHIDAVLQGSCVAPAEQSYREVDPLVPVSVSAAFTPTHARSSSAPGHTALRLRRWRIWTFAPKTSPPVYDAKSAA